MKKSLGSPSNDRFNMVFVKYSLGLHKSEGDSLDQHYHRSVIMEAKKPFLETISIRTASKQRILNSAKSPTNSRVESRHS